MSVLDGTQPQPDGSRPQAAARIGLVWAALVLVWVGTGWLRAEFLVARLPFDAWRMVESFLGGTLGVAVVIGACHVLDRRTLSSIGFSMTRRDLRAFGIGFGLWTGLAAAGLLSGALAGVFDVRFGAPTWTMTGWIVLQGFLVFTYEALPEELAMRGYVYTNLSEHTRRWLAVLGQAVLFTLWAFALVASLQALGIGTSWSIDIDRTVLFLTFGVSLALVRLWTGSLWGSIGYHLAFQVGMGLLSLDRLTVVRVDASDLTAVGITFWAFGIVLGGVVALAGLVRKERRQQLIAGPAPAIPSATKRLVTPASLERRSSKGAAMSGTDQPVASSGQRNRRAWATQRTPTWPAGPLQ